MPEKLVLIAEDDPDTGFVYREVLLYGGFEVCSAVNGADAIRLAREEHPDLILMDVNMPIMNGWDATVSLKKDPSTQHIPIVGISAIPDDEGREMAEEVGMDDYFAKPFPPAMVLQTVRRHFGMADPV
jgi:CheY-like chemotaxis protein